MSARLARTAFNLLFGVLLPVAPAAGAGFEIALPRGAEAMRPLVARHLLGEQGAGLDPAALELRMVELAPQINEFMIANGPSLERINDGRPLDSGLGAALQSVQLEVEFDFQSQVDPELDQMKGLIDRLGTIGEPDAAEIQEGLTLAEALKRYRWQYLSEYQRGHLDDYLVSLREARISHPVRPEDIERTAARIHDKLAETGLPVDGGLPAVRRVVYQVTEGFDVHASLLASPGTVRPNLLAAAPREADSERPRPRAPGPREPMDSMDFLDARDMREEFQKAAAAAKRMTYRDFSAQYERARADLPSPGDYLNLSRALHEAMWWQPEFEEALRHKLENWRVGDWARLAAIVRNEDGALELQIVASRVARFKAWVNDLQAGTAPVPSMLNARFTKNARYVHLYVGFPQPQQGRLDVGIVMTYTVPIAGTEAFRAEARALWDQVFSARALRAHEDYPKLIEMAGKMEEAGILPAGYSSRLTPLRSRWVWSALVAVLVLAVVFAVAAIGLAYAPFRGR